MTGTSKLYSDFLRFDLHIHTDTSRETKENDYKGIFSISKTHEKMTENSVGIFSLYGGPQCQDSFSFDLSVIFTF